MGGRILRTVSGSGEKTLSNGALMERKTEVGHEFGNQKAAQREENKTQHSFALRFQCFLSACLALGIVLSILHSSPSAFIAALGDGCFTQRN